MKLGTFITSSFYASLLLSIVGAFLKISHLEGADNWLILSVIALIMFIVASIYEVRTSQRIEPSEKTMWTIAFLFFPLIACVVYLLMGRRRIASNIN
jgi:TM2 domain-containing membrane protein YozV